MVLLIIICFLLLFYPIIWEYNDDKDGDTNKRQDVWIRIALAAVVTGIDTIIHIVFFDAGPFYFLRPAVMTFANFFLIFDYWIASRFSDDWFNYLGKYGTWANLKWWVKLGGKGRLIVRLVIYVIALIIYF